MGRIRLLSRVIGPTDLLILTATVGLPWLWGGVWPDASAAAAALIGLAAGWALARRGAAGLGLDRRSWWLLPAALLGAWAFAQTVPLPRTLVATISPKAAALQADAFGSGGRDANTWLRSVEDDARAAVSEPGPAVARSPAVLALAPGAPSSPSAFKLSMTPDVTRDRAFWYVALLLAFLVVHRRTANERRASIYRTVLFTFFVVLASVALLGRLTAPDRLLWIEPAPSPGRAFGPYVNPNHFAGAMELAVPWLLGYGLSGLTHRRRLGPPGARAVLALSGALVATLAALVAASKTATVTLTVSSVVLIVAGFGFRRGRARPKAIATTAAVVLLLGAVAAFGPLRGRLAEFASTRDVRHEAWGASWGMARDYLWTGSGFGAFSELIAAYLPRGESELWAQAHNDFLEVVLAGGLVAATLVLWLTVAFARRVVRAVHVEAASGRRLPALGMVLGLLALAVHEFVDFNLQIPANALLFVVMAAMAAAPLRREEAPA